MKEFMEPIWAFLFDKLGVFGLLIVEAIPVLLVGLVIVCLMRLKGKRAKRRRRSAAAQNRHSPEPAVSRPRVDPAALYEKARVIMLAEPDNMQAAFDYYLKAAKLGHVPAQYKAGSMYYRGFKNQAANTEQGMYWLKKAAEGGSAEARIEIAKIYSELRYRDPGICIDWLEELAGEDADLQFVLSRLYDNKLEWYAREHGYGPGQWKKDPVCVHWAEKGSYWLERAALNGSEDAGELYF